MDRFKMTRLSVVIVSVFLLLIFSVQSEKIYELELENGAHIIQLPDHSLEIKHPNQTSTILAQEKWLGNGEKSDLPQQWLAWYFRMALSGTSMGFTSFSSTFQVPPVPTKASNLAIFNALQASYDPTPYNWILQPVLSTGTWMLGSSAGWTLSSVMCNPNTNKCLYTKPIATSPGNKILGVITQVSGSLNSYSYEINITDTTAKTPTQTLLFSSAYFAPVAFATLEHNPEGPVTNCDTLPKTTAISFTNNVLKPTSMDMWQGSQTEFACGLHVDTFPTSGDSHLDIKL
jgi:hypothetical protein